MKINDYVRTYRGIRKIVKKTCSLTGEIFYQVDKPFDDMDGILTNTVYEEYVQSNKDFFMLLQIGDYVNGMKITLINLTQETLYFEDDNGYLIKSISKKEIKDIVTKEEYDYIKYSIGDSNGI